MLTWSKGAWSGWTPRCGDTPRPSASGWSGIWTRCCLCPPRPMTPATNSPAGVSSLSLVRYRTNDYSAPVAYGHRDVLVRGYVDQVVISGGAPEVIAPTSPVLRAGRLCLRPHPLPAAVGAEDGRPGSGCAAAGVGSAGRVSDAAASAGGTHGQTGQARIRAGAASAGELL